MGERFSSIYDLRFTIHDLYSRAVGQPRRKCESAPKMDSDLFDPYERLIAIKLLGRTVSVINSTTYEEANRAAGNWVRQRSR